MDKKKGIGVITGLCAIAIVGTKLFKFLSGKKNIVMTGWNHYPMKNLNLNAKKSGKTGVPRRKIFQWP